MKLKHITKLNAHIPKKKTIKYKDNWENMSEFEIRSCATKKSYKNEPLLPSMIFKTYHCGFCNGWHLATKSEYKNASSWKAQYRY